ncbi:nuclear transport factor 2 family protein [Gaetbulibacter sp. M240]|uniref:nuclear transport factor 2 family protein n=1 Tax=Gaetbulibacter sp. M240 TaxID=3126511 RepID=UPI00374F79B7
MRFGKVYIMVRVSCMLFLLFSVYMNAQTGEEVVVKRTIDTFFDGFHKGDTSIVASVMYKKAVLQTIVKTKEGQTLLRDEGLNGLLDAIANRPEDQKWDERLLDYDIKIDGLMANAWTPYEFWFNDAFSHCGVNSFQLMKSETGWKIIYLIDTRRKTGCSAAE